MASKKDKQAEEQAEEREPTPAELNEAAAQDRIAAEAEGRDVPDAVKTQPASGDFVKPPTTAEQRQKGAEVQAALAEEAGQTWPAEPDLSQPIPSNAPANPPQPDEEVTEEES